jgi:hypothetical protein
VAVASGDVSCSSTFSCQHKTLAFQILPVVRYTIQSHGTVVNFLSADINHACILGLRGAKIELSRQNGFEKLPLGSGVWRF